MPSECECESCLTRRLWTRLGFWQAPEKNWDGAPHSSMRFLLQPLWAAVTLRPSLGNGDLPCWRDRAEVAGDWWRGAWEMSLLVKCACVCVCDMPCSSWSLVNDSKTWKAWVSQFTKGSLTKGLLASPRPRWMTSERAGMMSEFPSDSRHQRFYSTWERWRI